ncbi:UDP-4-amino-4,6-dideoxy-N-acetyl-beta-L-altrosamine transaminase [Oceanirhabdus sp. W0125-5]|uniref:UDP-4-amino-4, 6-dideoxy-N-acetyl-beta-L-altrosamine transaminase n=1 Tax=Oceanirhabdus sp. W0125-5 TaxID=2999116 RepID=UPI0022F2D8BE|nr:UDP-4-amino-4,6-dideoxy-N-acetyl-beta-L-altrosamine transaminase [Oceanirhabdus sp. W0125-5]WBW99450.1 UDP-4-amino-4,6-dideoxy-N-acetyl-beta-L-altrosamine transaminase [Oceanirhabdus sp. W0125-5]
MSEFKVREKFLPYCLPLIEEDEINEVVDSLKSGWLSTGPKTREFEKQFADYVGAKYAIAMNSATAALHLALEAADVGPGDEVITTPMTFCASVNTIVHMGAIPVFVDIDPKTHCIDPKKIEKKITPKTKAIVPVHYAGHSCDMDEIMRIAKKHNLFVSEDAAHAVYTKYKNKLIGAIGDCTSFSFYATKNICTGEGGILTTNRDDIAQKLREISLHGMNKAAWNRYGKGGSWRYDVENPGYKYNMTDIQASLGLCQLSKLERMQKRREEIAEKYNKAFGEINEVTTPYTASYTRHAWHLYIIQLEVEKLKIDRDQFIEKLKEYNIGVSVHFIPVHYMSFYKNTFGYKVGDFPVVEEYFEKIISLPLYPKMSDEDVQYVIDVVERIIEEYKK